MTLPTNGILNCRQVREHEGLDLGPDVNIISDRLDAIHNRTVLSPFGFGKGERWHSRSEGLTRCDCYERGTQRNAKGHSTFERKGTQHICGGSHFKTDLQLPTRKHVVSLFPFAISRSRAGGNPVECAR